MKLKRPKQLQEILDIARFLLAEIETKDNAEIEEKKSKLEQLKSVLEMQVSLNIGVFVKIILMFLLSLKVWTLFRY